jgi:hypothetical protein
MGISRQNGTVTLTPNTKRQYIQQLRIPFKNVLVNPTAEIIEKFIKDLGVSGTISWLTDHNRGDPVFDGKVSINIVVSGDPVNLIVNDKSTMYECSVIDEAASQVYMSDGKTRHIFKLSIKTKTFDEVVSILTPYLYK